MAPVSRIPLQRQQTPFSTEPKKVVAYLKNQRRNLQIDWNKTAQAVNSLSNVGLLANLPPTGTAGRFYFATDTNTLFEDNGNGQWIPIGGSASTFRIINLPFVDSPYSAVLTTQATLYRASASAGADFLFTLPPATGSGELAVIKKMDANAHNIVVGPNGTDTIDGANSAANSTITIQYDDVRLVDSGAGTWDTW